jgi:Dolichyl-phosphate-mannose-protein mannosyltransferase
VTIPERDGILPEQHRPPIRERVWRSGAFLIALTVASWGQRMIERRQQVVDGLILLGLAAVLLVAAIRRSPHRRTILAWLAPPAQSSIDDLGPLVTSRQARLVLWVCTVAGVAYLEFADNRVSSSPLTAWLLAIACFLLNTVDRPRLTPPRRWPSASIGLALGGIITLAAFFLFFRLAAVPAEMTSDHAEKLLDVNDVLHGQWSIYFPRNTGREAIQFYLTAALVHWTSLPLSHLALKVGTALLGLLAVPFTFLLGRQLFGTKVGLLAAAFLAVSHWHVTLSRVGLRPSLTAVFAVPTLYFLFRALRGNRRNDWLACGLVLGLGLYGYTSMRVVPVLTILLIVLHAALDAVYRFARREPATGNGPRHGEVKAALGRRYWINALLAGLACLVVTLPMLRYMVDNPRMFWFRALTRVSSTERFLPVNLGSVVLDNLKNALLMFNYRGDVVWVTTVPFDPALDWMTGALFVLGVAFLLWRVLATRDRWSFYALLSLVMLLMPSVLSLAFPGENPSSSRAGGAAPLAMLVAALPLALVGVNLGRDWGYWGRRLAAGLGLLAVATSGALTYQWYFVQYDAQYRASAWNSREMAAVIQAFVGRGGDLRHAYHIGYPHWVDTRAIAINAGDITWRNGITDVNQVRAHTDDPAAKLYLVHPNDAASLGLLQALFLGGHASIYSSKTPGKDFVMFEVPAGRR